MWSLPKAQKGQLKEGMLADVVVLNENIFKVDIEPVKDMQADLTIFDGEIVYENRKSVALRRMYKCQFQISTFYISR